MLIRCMVYYKIQNDFDAILVSFSDQLIHVLIASEACINFPVITDIVTIVVLRGVKYRTEPEHIDPKVLKVGEFFNNTPEIAEAVSIGVLILKVYAIPKRERRILRIMTPMIRTVMLMFFFFSR